MMKNWCATKTAQAIRRRRGRKMKKGTTHWIKNTPATDIA
jgi:hypothetical protein